MSNLRSEAQVSELPGPVVVSESLLELLLRKPIWMLDASDAETTLIDEISGEARPARDVAGRESLARKQPAGAMFLWFARDGSFRLRRGVEREVAGKWSVEADRLLLRLDAASEVPVVTYNIVSLSETSLVLALQLPGNPEVRPILYFQPITEHRFPN